MLESAGIPVWRDTADLWPGKDWRARIRDAITRYALVFILVSPAIVLRARRATSARNSCPLLTRCVYVGRIIHGWYLYGPTNCDVPDFELGAGRTLASIQRADLFGPSRDLAAGRLVAAVQRLLRQPPSACNWIVKANPRLWLRSRSGFDFPTVDCLYYGQRAYGNGAGAKSGGTTWYFLQGTGDGWAWGNSAYLQLV